MGSEGPLKRPFCRRCSKPCSTCLCSRLSFPPLDNSIPVTVLQHTLESRHPLNSVRVAKLGLKNLAVVPISDVNFRSLLLVQPLYPNPRSAPPKIWDISDPRTEKSKICCFDDYILIRIDRGAKPDMRPALASQVGKDAILHGFTATKFQGKKMRLDGGEIQEVEEYSITVPPGTALLYPSEDAVGLDVAAAELDVKHLIVLDGTWGKARRIYCENPWLRLVPHLKLETKGESLYSEVRHEPKAGCVSTVESIVSALKLFGGGGAAELDELLGVFESMVGDQRRCKDEKFQRMQKSS